ncbi:MAG: TRAP transporter small permease [Rhodospirillales bacterium]|jgi:TRAP-type C4-dicarboxylate transport system permease small subunit|nr:TRAP transporter small permease [Rhodospirillales bacterium]
MRVIDRFICGLTNISAVVAATICVLMFLLIIAEIVLRTFFATSTYMMDELVGYGVAAMTFLGLAYSLKTEALIRISLVLDKLNPRARTFVDVACATATLLVIAFVANFFWISLFRHYTRGTSSGTMADVPNWIPEAVIFVGLVAFCLQMVAFILSRVLQRSNNSN